MKTFFVLAAFFVFSNSAYTAPAFLQCDFFNAPVVVNLTMPKTFGIVANPAVAKISDSPTELVTSIEPIEVTLPNGLVYKSPANSWIFALYYQPDQRGPNAKITREEFQRRGLSLFEGELTARIPVTNQFGYKATLRGKVVNGSLALFDLNPSASQLCYFKP